MEEEAEGSRSFCDCLNDWKKSNDDREALLTMKNKSIPWVQVHYSGKFITCGRGYLPE